jgi:hypothetical protein
MVHSVFGRMLLAAWLYMLLWIVSFICTMFYLILFIDAHHCQFSMWICELNKYFVSMPLSPIYSCEYGLLYPPMIPWFCGGFFGGGLYSLSEHKSETVSLGVHLLAGNSPVDVLFHADQWYLGFVEVLFWMCPLLKYDIEIELNNKLWASHLAWVQPPQRNLHRTKVSWVDIEDHTHSYISG